MTVLGCELEMPSDAAWLRFELLGKCTPSLQTRNKFMGWWLGSTKFVRGSRAPRPLVLKGRPDLSPSTAKLVTQGARRSTCDPL